MIPKGAYAIFALASVVCALLIWSQRQTAGAPPSVAALAAFVWLIVSAATVALNWGGTSALADSAIVLSLVMALALRNARARAPLWPDDLRVQWGAFGFVAIVALATAVFAGGAYMADRFSSSERDLEGRLRHWRDGIAMLDSPADWLVGKGLGRFPENYFFRMRHGEFPGSYRIGSQGDNRFLILSGPERDVGFGELFRVAQRVSPVLRGRYTVTLDVRAPRAVQLHVEVCEKHLLYHHGCALANVPLAATGAAWRRYDVALDGRELTGGPWYAPRLAFFAVAVDSPGHRVEIDNMSLAGPDGRNLLVNGDFTDGMARWFFTSDRFHLPWHIKNLFLNVLFDQGLAGLLLMLLLTGAALWRLVAGSARRNPAAPFLAAALTGFIVVGAFDSLLDVPRLAFLYYLLVLLSLMLPPAATRVDTAPGYPRPG